MQVRILAAQRRRFLYCLGLAWLGWLGCQPDRLEDDPYVFRQPAHFPAATYTFENNPISREGFLLGKKLFFDPILSVDNTVSCGSCHIQSLAFADLPLHPFSIGVDGQAGTRNAPGLANMAFKETFFWDGGVTHLDFVPIVAIESPVEMDERLARVVEKLAAHPDYPRLFEQAFGPSELNAPQLLHALSQFMLLMVSDQSPYDQHLRGEKTLDAPALRGKAIFEQRCGTCHAGTLQTDHSFRNNGIDSIFADEGRARISTSSSDLGKFRVPSLRNVALTAPYMHNAKFESLAAVLDHYDQGVLDSPTLDPLLRQADGRLGIPLTAAEKADLIAFLNSLTDDAFRRNPLFFAE